MKNSLLVLIAFVLFVSIVFGVVTTSFAAVGDIASEGNGKTLADVLGMDGATYMSWLMSHENDNYYLGTPYMGYDHRNPNGDCAGAHGTLDKKGVAGMNCTGFM